MTSRLHRSVVERTGRTGKAVVALLARGSVVAHSGRFAPGSRIGLWEPCKAADRERLTDGEGCLASQISEERARYTHARSCRWWMPCCAGVETALGESKQGRYLYLDVGVGCVVIDHVRIEA